MSISIKGHSTVAINDTDVIIARVYKVKPMLKVQSIKTRALTLAHAIKSAYTNFSSALRTAYSVIKSDSAKRLIMRGLQRAYTLCEQLGLVSKSTALFNAFIVLLELPALRCVK